MKAPSHLIRFCLWCACCHSGAEASATILLSPESGYSITWNGNDGDHFGDYAPDNLALSARGAVAIASGELGPEISKDYHLVGDINDGRYGNSYSWIGGTSDPAPYFAGVIFSRPSLVSAVAFGRDNGGEASVLADRFAGSYVLQITTDGLAWSDVGTITLDAASEDAAPGGGYTGYLRHRFELSTVGGTAVLATGLRLVVSGTGISTGLAIDELEVFGTAIPEPSATGALAAGLVGAASVLRRRRAHRPS